MPGSASHLWRDDWEAKGQGWGCLVCHYPGLEWGTRSLVVQMWVTGACGCAVWVSMCPSVRPCCVSCSPMGGARTTQTSTPGSSLPGSPRTPSAGDLVGASAGSGATPVPDAQVSTQAAQPRPSGWPVASAAEVPPRPAPLPPAGTEPRRHGGPAGARPQHGHSADVTG